MAPFPPPPVDFIDWSNVGFKVREVNGHIEATYTKTADGKSSWSSPKFVASPYLSIHGMSPALNYGVQCYEGLKAFRHPDGSISIFRPDRNAARMQRSATFVSIPTVPEELFLESVKLAVSVNAEFVPPHETASAMYIRPLLFASSAQLPLQPAEEYKFVVFVMPTGVYHGVQSIDALILEDFDRSAPEGTGSAKIGGNYAPVLRHSESARKEGYGITLHLDSKTRTEIDEFSTSGFIGVLQQGEEGAAKKMTIVQPSSKNIIQSVTAESVLQIARDIYGYAVEERRVEYEELPKFAEVMACGTAASLVPIKSITLKTKGEKFEYPVPKDGGPGPVCADFLTTLKGIQLGKIEDKFGWNFKVDAPPKGFVESLTDGGGGATNGQAVGQLP